MFKSSPVSRAGVVPAGNNSRNEPVNSRSRFRRCGVARRVCKEEAPVNDQKRSVNPEEKTDTAQRQKQKSRAVSATTISRESKESRESPTATEKDKTVVATQTSAMTDEASQGASADNASDDNLHHRECYRVTWPGHTDACWNDPRWPERNRQRQEQLEQNIQSGRYRNDPSAQVKVMGPDNRHEFKLACYHGQDPDYAGYSNIQITQCADAKVVANINRANCDMFCRPFRWNGDSCILSGHSDTAPLLINLNTAKIYQQRGDHYDFWELNWDSVTASPDGNTFLVRGLIYGGWPSEYRFYDASKPDQGFRFLPTGLTMAVPGKKDATLPEWGVDASGRTTVSITLRKGYDEEDCVDENGHHVVYKMTFRREEGRMVEVASETIPIELESDF